MEGRVVGRYMHTKTPESGKKSPNEYKMRGSLRKNKEEKLMIKNGKVWRRDRIPMMGKRKQGIRAAYYSG